MFIARREDNSIYGAWSVRQWDGQEEVADDDADLAAFMEAMAAPPERTPEQKLAAAGLSVPELKQLLGLE